MRSPRRLPLIGVVALIAGAVVLSACGSGYSKIRAQWGAKYGVPTWVVNALTPTKDANGVPRVTLQATPGEELSIDLAGTVLNGKVFRKGTRNGYRCIDKVEWVLEGPTSTLKSGAETWLSGSAQQRNECNLGAVDRILRITMPGDLPAGSTLEMKVYSDACGDKSCRSWRTSPSASASAWITGLVNVDLDVVTPAPPTARLVARATPIQVGAFAPSGSYWREIDARLSTDPQGGYLTYAWDLDGDGQYGGPGDQSDPLSPVSGDPARGLPDGVAVVPVANLPNLPGTTTVGVRVTNQSGESATASLTLTVTDFSLDEYRNRALLSASSPAVGESMTLTVVKENYASAYYACVDLNGDGVYTDVVPFDPHSASGTKTVALTAAAAGPHLVTVAFAPSSADCEANPDIVIREVYVSQKAMRSGISRQGSSTYAGTARMRLFKTVVKKNPKMVGFSARGEILAGRYSLRTPAKAGGVKRPTGLASFRGGHYAQKTNELVFTPVSETKTIVTGSGTILLRGKKNALLCATIDSTGTATTYTFVGGKGVGATVQGTMTGAPLDFTGAWAKAAGLKIKNGVVTQNRALNETATMAVTTAKATKLPKSCRSLVRYLPKAKKK